MSFSVDSFGFAHFPTTFAWPASTTLVLSCLLQVWHTALHQDIGFALCAPSCEPPWQHHNGASLMQRALEAFLAPDSLVQTAYLRCFVQCGTLRCTSVSYKFVPCQGAMRVIQFGTISALASRHQTTVAPIIRIVSLSSRRPVFCDTRMSCEAPAHAGAHCWSALAGVVRATMQTIHRRLRAQCANSCGARVGVSRRLIS